MSVVEAAFTKLAGIKYIENSKDVDKTIANFLDCICQSPVETTLEERIT